uniref:Uncharacterized protein n=1 Tax=Tanacetum cinerariifolium TaxID=118510 RepID=A0A6L2K944_TANCI|nr:hypothetical protein [Tanacetum cinerariifolium]
MLAGDAAVAAAANEVHQMTSHYKHGKHSGGKFKHEKHKKHGKFGKNKGKHSGSGFYKMVMVVVGECREGSEVDWWRWRRRRPEKVKENQEKDKIGSKLDKNGKRIEAGKSLKQLQWVEKEKLSKTQKEWPKMQIQSKAIQVIKKGISEGPKL